MYFETRWVSVLLSDCAASLLLDLDNACSSQSVSGRPELNMLRRENSDGVIIIHSHSDMPESITITDTGLGEGPSPQPPAPPSQSGLQAQSYVTQVTVSSMCLCCRGQQARRCSVNIGEAITVLVLYSKLIFT